MNENTNQTAPKTFDIIDGNTLMAREYPPLQFAVEKILPHGLFILAGSGKIGKSWLSLDLCVKRGIDSEIVNTLMRKETLYEDGAATSCLSGATNTASRVSQASGGHTPIAFSAWIASGAISGTASIWRFRPPSGCTSLKAPSTP
jgi:hypothetical protein